MMGYYLSTRSRVTYVQIGPLLVLAGGIVLAIAKAPFMMAIFALQRLAATVAAVDWLPQSSQGQIGHLATLFPRCGRSAWASRTWRLTSLLAG